MTKPSYSVTMLEPEDARAELARLWTDNLPIEGGFERKFAFLYREAPERADGVFLLAAEQDGARRWVGTAGVNLRRVWARGRELRAGLLADLAVDREHRSVMPALALVRAVRTWALDELDLAYGFPNKHAEGVFTRVGYKPLGRMGRWARVLRHAGYVARVRELELPGMPPRMKKLVVRAAGVPMLANLASRAVDTAKMMKVTGAALQASRQLKLTWHDRADDRIDALWQTARGDYDAIGVRSARLLRWRFPVGPNVQIALGSSRKDGAPRAYAVIERDGVAAHVRDLFGHREDLGALLDLLIPALYGRGAASVSMRYLGPRWLIDLLEGRGFVRRVSDRLVAVGVKDGLDPEVRDAVTSADRWYVTDVDEDT